MEHLSLETQCQRSLTPRLIDSKMYSDVTSNVRSNKNAPTITVAAKVEVLLKIVLYTFPAIPAILLICYPIPTDY